MNEDKLILSKYSSGYFVSSVKENKKWNNIEQRYKISKEIYEDIEQLQNNWNELKKWLEEVIEDINKLEYQDSYDISEKITLKNIVNKMQELEQGKDE